MDGHGEYHPLSNLHTIHCSADLRDDSAERRVPWECTGCKGSSKSGLQPSSTPELAALFLSQEPSFQIGPKLVNHMIDCTERDSPTHPSERGSGAAISGRIIGVRKTTRSSTAQQPGPVKRVSSCVFTRHYGSDHCVHQSLLEGARPLAKVTRILVKQRRKDKGCKESGRCLVRQSRS